MWLAVDENGGEFIYSMRPSRGHQFWVHAGTHISVPKGTIQRLLNYPLTWDDDCQEIVEYKDKDLKEDKVIKQNIKMRVTPEQSKKVQEICFANGIYWTVSGKGIKYTDKLFLEIEKALSYTEDEHLFNTRHSKEVDADLFIRTSGTCEDTTLNEVNIDFKDEEYFKLEVKVFNLKKQLEKYVVKIANQKEEVTRLLSQKEDLQNRLNISNKTVGMSINNDIKLIRLLEEKDAIIKYLENKLAKKTNETYEKKVMSFEELYIKQADEYYKKVEDKVMGFVKKNLKRELNN